MTKSSPPYLLISSLLAALLYIWSLFGRWIIGFQHIEVTYLLEQYALFILMIIFDIIGPQIIAEVKLIFFIPVLFLAYLIPIYIVVRVLLIGWSSFRSDKMAREDETTTEGATPQSYPRSSQ